MKIYTIIPAYNESAVITSVIHDLVPKTDAVIVIDDGSKDETAKLAQESGAVVLRHFLNRGQGAALQTGLEYALKKGADIIVTFDADGQHRTEDIAMLVNPVERGEVDVVLGSRFLNGKIEQGRWSMGKKNQIPFRKYVLLKFATFFTRLTTGLQVTDTHNGLRAFSRKGAQTIQIRQDGYAHASEILEEISKHNLRYKEVPVTIYYTDYSMKKGQSIFHSFRIIWDLILGRLTR